MTHNEFIVDLFTDEDTRAAFALLGEDEHNQWIMDAIAEYEGSDQTRADQDRYIGKVALAHLYIERKEK